MGFKSIQDILKTVDLPSQYAGVEINAVIKQHDSVDFKIVLAFPDLYEIGTSHFGLQILYHILNKEENIVAERVFAPAPDMEKELRENGIPMFSRETKTPLDQFDVIGFSLLYELNYTNILTILDLSGIPFYSAERDDHHPLVIAGGPCTFNPEPVADFFDAMVIGDGEDVVLDMATAYIEWKKSGKTRKDLLRSWSRIEGVYIPGFFKAEYKDINGNPLQILIPEFPEYSTVKRAVLPDLEQSAFPEKPVIPFGRPVHERMRLEISRGCSRGCRFCQAGMIYRPVRERKVDTLMDMATKTICNTGYEDMSLLSLSAGDYENLNTLMNKLIDVSDADQNPNNRISFSLPSIRAGKLNHEMMETIKRIRKTGFTIAPEAGSQRLRDVINKGLTEDDIVNTVKDAFDLGWKVIKLYFMIGLPTETREDLEAMVELVKTLRKIKGKRAQINVSVTTFIPKAHCPFQWAGQITQDEAWSRILWLKEQLNMSGVSFKWGKTQISYLEGLMARGDRRMAKVILSAYKKGCRLDGWTEHFNLEAWNEAITEENIDPDLFSHRTRNTDEPLPWDHIDSRISKSFMMDEWEKSMTGVLTDDCRNGTCSLCGICDFKEIKPRIEDKINYEKKEFIPEPVRDIRYKRIKCHFQKTGDARFMGHLEMVNLFAKAIRRAEIPVKYTSGFHKIIKMTFGNPLPVGYESLCEFFVIEVHEDFDTNRIMTELDYQIPDGLKITEVEEIEKKDIQENQVKRFSISIRYYVFSQSCIDTFEKESLVPYEKVNKKGCVKSLNLKDFIRSIVIEQEDRISFDVISAGGIHIKPEDAIKQIFSISEEVMKKADIMKLTHFG